MNKIFAAVFGLLFFLCSVCSAYAPTGRMYVTMLDVGQAEAFLIETASQNILIDTGSVESRQSLLSQLDAAGITRFEKIILTHPHEDHIGGVRAVLDNYDVDEIIDNGYVSTSPLYRDYRRANVTFTAATAGDVINLGIATFKVFAPSESLTTYKINDRSIVGKLIYGDFSIMFTGDAEKRLETWLSNTYAAQLQSTILKASHHGSKTSSVEDFVFRVSPSYVLISAGKDNAYGHPHKRPLRTYRECYVLPENIFCTAFNGSVRIETDGKNYLIIPMTARDWVEDYTGEVISVTRII